MRALAIGVLDDAVGPEVVPNHAALHVLGRAIGDPELVPEGAIEGCRRLSAEIPDDGVSAHDPLKRSIVEYLMKHMLHQTTYPLLFNPNTSSSTAKKQVIFLPLSCIALRLIRPLILRAS